MIKQLLAALTATFASAIAVAFLAGCQTPSQSVLPPIGPIAVGGFVQQWDAPLELGPKDFVTTLFVRDDKLIVYTKQNIVYSLSQSGGQIQWIRHIARRDDVLLPPIILNGTTVIAAGPRLEKVSPGGTVQDPIVLPHSIRSGLTGGGKYIYCGLDFTTSGRLAKIDITRPYNNERWELMTGAGMSAAPVLFQGTIFAAGEDSRVYAVGEDRSPLWPLPGGFFQTEGRNIADLKADDFGVYVASADTKLYCLDRATGKLKWQYYAAVPLLTPPSITADSVYQFLEGQGMASIDKISPEPIHKPRWIAAATTAYLGEEGDLVFLRAAGNSIVGVDKKTGEEKFHSIRTDIIAFASDSTTGAVYVATSGGEVLAVRAVTKPGVVGQVALVPVGISQTSN